MSEVIGGGRFELRRRLGAGGMGVVFEAIDHERELRVALKRLHRAEGQTLYRFKNEFRALQDLDHPNLVRLGELFEDGADWFFTMELVEGTDIGRWIRPGGALDLDRLRSAFGQLAAGLEALHGAGKVHRDIKPGNVLVDPDGRVVLVDFGLVADQSITRERSDSKVVGTAAYMAPEQAASKELGPPADCYAVGVLLYEALTGDLPFTGNMLSIFAAKQQREPPPPSEVASGVPPDLDRLCSELLRFAPAARPTAGEIRRALGGPAPASRQSTPTSTISGERIPFVGRAEELARLEALLATVSSGRPAAAFVVGESGVGKSRLLRELTERLRSRDRSALVLRGRCYERETVNYKAVDAVIDALSRHLQQLGADDLADLIPEEAGVMPLVFPVMSRVPAIARMRRSLRAARDPIAARARAFSVLGELLGRLTERRAVVIVIDDYQWADADSELLLADLLRPPDAPPIALIASSRVRPDSPLPGAEIMELGPLPAAEARELAARLLAKVEGGGADDAAAIADDCAGHPMFIDEMIRHAALTGERPGARRLDDAISARVAELSDEAARALRPIAAAGVPLGLAVAREAAGLTPDQMDRAVSQLRVGRFVRAPRPGVLEPYHDRMREAAVAALSPAARREVHARLAQALESSELAYDRPELLVEHLIAAGEEQAAASYAMHAARRAAARLAFERAAAFYRIALDRGDHDADDRRGLQIELADALAHAGRGRDAAPVYLAASSNADPATRVECQRKAARHLLMSGHFESGIGALGEILAEQGLALPASPKRALVSLLWRRARLRLRGLRWDERHPRDIADSQLARVDVLLDVGEALGMFDSIRGADFQLRGLLAALQLGERSRIARAIGVEAIYIASQGPRRLRRARELIERMTSIAQAERDPFLEALAGTAAGIVAYLGGELVAAADLLRATEAHFEDLGSTWELNNARLFRMFATRWTGGFAERSREIEVLAADAHRRGDLYTDTSLRLTNNLLMLALGRADDAELEIEAVSWRPPANAFHLQHWWELEARSELALYHGTAAAALPELEPGFGELARSLFTRIQFVRANSRWVRGRLSAAVAASDPQARREVNRAARALARERVDYAAVWSELLFAAVAEPAAAVEHLARVEAAADPAGLPLLGVIARRRRGELIGDGDAVAAADAWLRDEGVAEPARLADVFAPGISR